MKKLPQSNIYGAGAVGIAELFGDYLEDGSSPENCVVLVLGAKQPSDNARNAVVKSLSALGYGPNAATFATVAPQDPAIEGGDVVLDEQATFMLVEGLDPLFMIIVDEPTSLLVGRAYRCPLEADAACRVFGRPAVSFRDLEGMLASDAGKQRAWRLFKSLPKRS